MKQNLIPTWHTKSFRTLNIQQLRTLNCKLLFCDIDNTLASPYQTLPDEKVKKFIHHLKENQIRVVLLSNNHKARVQLFAEALDVEYLYEVKKPKIHKIHNFLEKEGIDVASVISVGDQIMTDILCANRLKVRNILVDRLTNKDQPITFFPRLLDKFYRKKLKKKHLLVEF